MAGIFSKHRQQIWNQSQHPYKHNLAEFGFTSEALPGVDNAEDAFAWIIAVLYPLMQSAVPTTADLPTGDAGVTFTIGSPGIVTGTVAEYKNEDQVFFTEIGGLPPEIVPGTVYYIQNKVGNDFNLSTDKEGLNLLDFSTAGTAPNTMENINNAYRVVTDDGDGKAASYRWEKREGDASYKWYKVYDMDWGQDSILAAMMDVTNDVYVVAKGKDEVDENGVPIAGTFAGQNVFGGVSPNTNLTLHANSGDGVGPQTGFVQFADQVRPYLDATINLGTIVERFLNGYFSGSVVVDTMTVSSGSITDTTGSIDFDDENLSTTGTLEAGDTTVTHLDVNNGSNTLSVSELGLDSANGVITFLGNSLEGNSTSQVKAGKFIADDGTETVELNPQVAPGESGFLISTKKFSFDDSDLSKIKSAVVTENVDAGSITVDDLTIDNDTVSSSADLNFSAVGDEIHTAALATFNNDVNVIGSLDVSVDAQIDDVHIYDSTVEALTGDLSLDSAGVIQVNKDLLPQTSTTQDLGSPSKMFKDLYLDGGVSDGTNSIDSSVLTTFRDSSVGVVDGASLFYDAGSQTWLPSVPDTEIDHGAISGLGDDDHTQYALLAGRAGGQVLNGGAIATETLQLKSYNAVTTGVEVKDLSLDPIEGAAYSTQWDGFDVGSTGKYYRDVYTKGQLFGARAENRSVLTGALVNNEGRMMWHSTQKRAFWDNGGAFTAPIFETGSTQATAGADITVSQTYDYVVRLTAATSVAQLQVPPFNSFKSLILINATGSQIVIRDNFGGAGSEVILTGLAKDMKVKADGCVHLVYDFTSSAWRVAGGAGSGGGLYEVDSGTTSVFSSGVIISDQTIDRQVIKVVGNGGAVTGVTVTPGQEGQETLIFGTSDTNTVTITHASASHMNGDVTLYNNSLISFITVGGDVYEQYRRV